MKELGCQFPAVKNGEPPVFQLMPKKVGLPLRREMASANPIFGALPKDGLESKPCSGLIDQQQKEAKCEPVHSPVECTLSVQLGQLSHRHNWRGVRYICFKGVEQAPPFSKRIYKLLNRLFGERD
ncbi:hypothetical protein WI25_06070 [Burkholderia cepacia]|nr:hypothetical protein WI25_06070 [Burkholderia cepacia]